MLLWVFFWGGGAKKELSNIGSEIVYLFTSYKKVYISLHERIFIRFWQIFFMYSFLLFSCFSLFFSLFYFCFCLFVFLAMKIFFNYFSCFAKIKETRRPQKRKAVLFSLWNITPISSSSLLTSSVELVKAQIVFIN